MDERGSRRAAGGKSRRGDVVVQYIIYGRSCSTKRLDYGLLLHHNGIISAISGSLRQLILKS